METTFLSKKLRAKDDGSLELIHEIIYKQCIQIGVYFKRVVSIIGESFIMPINIKMLGKDQVISINCIGSINPQELAIGRREVFDLHKENRITNVLVDSTMMDEQVLTSDLYFHTTSIINDYVFKGLTYAIIATGLHKDSAMFFEHLVARHGIKCQIFPTREEAMQWFNNKD